MTTNTKKTNETKQTKLPERIKTGPSGPIMRGYSQPFAVVDDIYQTNLLAGIFGDMVGGEAAAKEFAAELVKRWNRHDELGSGQVQCGWSQSTLTRY